MHNHYQRIIYTSPCGLYRIRERPDAVADLEDLKGDCFNFEASGYTGTREQLAEEEKQFEDLVLREGVFGYVLERWNPSPGVGWEHVDSCFGFVGQYSPDDKSGLFDHYIVEEMKSQIPTPDEDSKISLIYAKTELEKLVPSSEYPMSFQVRDSDGNATKWMSVRAESLEAFKAFCEKTEFGRKGKL